MLNMTSPVTPLKASELMKLLELAIKEYGDLPVYAQAGDGEDPGDRTRRGPVFSVVNGGHDTTTHLDILAYRKLPKWMPR